MIVAGKPCVKVDHRRTERVGYIAREIFVGRYKLDTASVARYNLADLRGGALLKKVGKSPGWCFVALACYREGGSLDLALKLDACKGGNWAF